MTREEIFKEIGVRETPELRKIVDEIVKSENLIDVLDLLYEELAKEKYKQMMNKLDSRRRGRFDIMAKINDSYDKGYEQGVKQGILKRKREIARNLIKFGESIEMISKITGLTEAEILELSQDSQ